MVKSVAFTGSNVVLVREILEGPVRYSGDVAGSTLCHDVPSGSVLSGLGKPIGRVFQPIASGDTRDHPELP
jgi:hypothetical protein